MVSDDTKRRWMLRAIDRMRFKAARAGLGFDLKPDDFELPDECPVLGCPLEYEGWSQWNTATVDRKDSAKGWVSGNIWIISLTANSIRRRNVTADFRQLCISMRSRVPHGFFLLPKVEQEEILIERRRIAALVEDFNLSFPKYNSKLEYPTWLSTSAEEIDPVEALRRELNEELG
jgi:hypothetical protein